MTGLLYPVNIRSSFSSPESLLSSIFLAFFFLDCGVGGSSHQVIAVGLFQLWQVDFFLPALTLLPGETFLSGPVPLSHDYMWIFQPYPSVHLALPFSPSPNSG